MLILCFYNPQQSKFLLSIPARDNIGFLSTLLVSAARPSSVPRTLEAGELRAIHFSKRIMLMLHPTCESANDVFNVNP